MIRKENIRLSQTDEKLDYGAVKRPRVVSVTAISSSENTVSKCDRSVRLHLYPVWANRSTSSL